MNNSLSNTIIQHLKSIIKNECRELSPASVKTEDLPPQTVPQEEMRYKSIKMVAFDVYGTILHSRLGEIATLEGVEERSIEIPELNLELDTGNAQHGIRECIAEMHLKLKKTGIDFPEVNIVQIWKNYATAVLKKSLSTEEAMICALRFELAVNPVWTMPGAMTTLHWLQEQGYALGIISNAQFYTPLILETLYGKQWESLNFETVTWSYQHAVGKPSRELYTRFLSNTQYQPSEILYVGNDKQKDIVPSRNSGMKPLLFAGDRNSFRPHSPRLDSIAHTLIFSLQDILTLLQEAHTARDSTTVKLRK